MTSPSKKAIISKRGMSSGRSLIQKIKKPLNLRLEFLDSIVCFILEDQVTVFYSERVSRCQVFQNQVKTMFLYGVSFALSNEDPIQSLALRSGLNSRGYI